MFDTPADAKQKLGSTVILMHEAPIYVVDAVCHIANVGGKPAIEGVALKYLPLPYEGVAKASDYLMVPLDEAVVDFRSLGTRLGYMNAASKNGDRQAIFVARSAKRQSVQGINGSNLVFSNFDGGDGLKMPCQFENHYTKKHFTDMLKGSYPSKNKAALALEGDEGLTSVAFSRWFAFRRKKVGPFYLEYKGKEIGWTTDLKKINLSMAYSHLQETLEYYDISFKLTAA